MKIAVVSYITFFFFQSCIAQTKGYTSIPQKYSHSRSVVKNWRLKAQAEVSNAYDITKVLPKGYVTDGSIDYTSLIQRAINSHSKVVFPNFPILINEKGISLRSNSTVIFRRRSKLIMAPNAESNYKLLRLFNISNVLVYFPVLEGERYQHKSDEGQWGMGISIAGSSNIRIIHPVITKCWGDGIYIGRIGEEINRNIDIYYARIDDNRRNGISIVCVDGLTLESPIIGNSKGTPPMSGIDIEPNNNKDLINNIQINNPITFNNEYGILMVLGNLPGGIQHTVNITIEDHIDDSSSRGLVVSRYKNSSEAELRGRIKIVNPIWKNSREIHKPIDQVDFYPDIEIINPAFQNE